MNLAEGSNRAAMGATLNKSKLSAIEIPLPPIEEQRRIAAILDQVDALRAKRREALALLDDLTQSIFFDMFRATPPNVRFADVILGMRNGVSPSSRGGVPATV